jgi:multicomponent Na+:H+ antiporter subunit E
MTRKWPLTGLVLAVLWLFIRGVEPGGSIGATLRNIGGELIIGSLVGLPVAYALRSYYADDLSVNQSLRVLPAALAYLGSFFWELLTANVDVAYRVLSPSLPINPDVIAVPLRVESDVAITTIANSISLTPGTLTMDHDAEANILYVHAITADDLDSLLAPIRRWEDYALIMFEGRDPSLEAPHTPVPRSTEEATGDGGVETATGGELDGR